eukprot:SAG11_NODE_1694_length_4437_cov_4.558552_2_plen_71_part_00
MVSNRRDNRSSTGEQPLTPAVDEDPSPTHLDNDTDGAPNVEEFVRVVNLIKSESQESDAQVPTQVQLFQA